MPCYHPVRAWQRGAAKPIFFVPAVGAGGYRVLELPCGQCIGCRLDRSRQWAARCVHEARMHSENCFVTCTYDSAHLPSDLSLRPRDFTLFHKRWRESLMREHRARKRRGEAEPTPNPRFYMCGEYGERFSRPHYHAILFGFYPKDAVLYRKTDRGDNIYTSRWLDRVWGLGQCFVGAMSFESAAYIARYCLKKVYDGSKHRAIFDPTTGEIIYREHEYARMSNRPGIGAAWFDRFFSDVFPHDRVVVRGVKNPVPKYYVKRLDAVSPLYAADVKAKRVVKAEARNLEMEAAEGFDWQRLEVHEKVKLAALNLLRRSD